MEKNWFLFSPSVSESYIHYSISDTKHGPSHGRTFARLLGNGLTTPNMTDPMELPCIQSAPLPESSSNDTMPRSTDSIEWHQATNALRLVLCNRSDPSCQVTTDSTAFFAAVHRKVLNHILLPLRYERYFVLWSATAPFGMLAMSRHPLLFANETVSGFDAWQNRNDGDSESKERWAAFTYTVSLAWAARPDVEVEDLGTGYLDDEVVVSVGVDDSGAVFGRSTARDLLTCLRLCPGRAE